VNAEEQRIHMQAVTSWHNIRTSPQPVSC